MIPNFIRSWDLVNGGLILFDDKGRLWELVHLGTPPQSPREPATSPQTKPKRGRPTNADREARKAAANPKPYVDASGWPLPSEPESVPTFSTCKWCKRDLPTEVIPQHEENCYVAAKGPYTHVATPGDKS